MNNTAAQLKEIFGDRCRENEPLAKHLNFKIGGPAKWFCEVKTVDELQKAIAAIGETPYVVLGGGSNMLASDQGFDGVVFKLALRETKIEVNTVTADAGVISAALARQTAAAGLAGFTWAISLPGTIGGAVRGNAGCFGGEMKYTVKSVDVLRDGQVVTLTNEEMEFGYRESRVKHSSDIVLRAHLELTPGDPEQLKEELNKTVESRKASQPLYAGSAGCMFKNYEIKDEADIERLRDKLIPEEMLEARRVSAGWLIDHADLKGEKIGNAQVSNEHANFVVNLGGATADEVVQLISVVKMKIRERFGIQLQEEVQLIGF